MSPAGSSSLSIGKASSLVGAILRAHTPRGPRPYYEYIFPPPLRRPSRILSHRYTHVHILPHRHLYHTHPKNVARVRPSDCRARRQPGRRRRLCQHFDLLLENGVVRRQEIHFRKQRNVVVGLLSGIAFRKLLRWTRRRLPRSSEIQPRRRPFERPARLLLRRRCAHERQPNFCAERE